MSSTTYNAGLDMKADLNQSRRSSIDSSIDELAVASAPITPATTISTSSKSTTSSTKSKRQKMKSWAKRVGNGMLQSLAYANALEYAPGSVQYHERRTDERTPDEVLNDIYAYRLWTLG